MNSSSLSFVSWNVSESTNLFIISLSSSYSDLVINFLIYMYTSAISESLAL